MDIETLIRDAARKLCQQYQLPTHIVEEEARRVQQIIDELDSPDDFNEGP